MEQWRKNIYILWIAVFIASACWTMVMPYMPVFLQDELGVTTGVAAWAGMLGAVNSLGMAVMSPVWGAMGDRMGRKPMMLRAGSFLALAYILMAFVTGPWGLLGVRVMIGVLTGFVPTATALVGATTPQAHVGKALSLLATAAQSGTIIGPLFGGVLMDLIGLRQTMLANGLMVGAATLLVLVAVKEQFTPSSERHSSMWHETSEVMQNRTFAAILVTTMLLQASLAAMEPILVPYIKGLLGPAAPNWLAGAIYALPGVAFVIAAPWWAARGERLGYVRTVLVGLAVGAVLVLPQGLSTSGWSMGGLRLTAGLALAAVSPGASALIAQVVPRAQRGRAFGLNQSALSVGAMVGPLMGGFLGDAAGPRVVFPVTALLLGLGAAWTWFVLRPLVTNQKRNEVRPPV